MKVKELRSWLENIGEKHKQHYKLGTSHTRQVNQNENNLLTIQTKPSNASTCQMSSADSIVSEDGTSFSLAISSSPKVEKEIITPLGGQCATKSLEEGDCYYPDPSFVYLSDESSVESDEEDSEDIQFVAEKFHAESNSELENKSSRRVTFGGIQGAETMSKNQLSPIQVKRASLVDDRTNSNSSTRIHGHGSTNTMEVVPSVKQAKSIFRKKLNPAAVDFQPKKPNLENPTDQPIRLPTSSVGTVIEMFGGQGGRKTIVSRRKDELQRRWSENRAVTHVKKTKWCVCEKTGVYKRKVVVEPEYRSV